MKITSIFLAAALVAGTALQANAQTEAQERRTDRVQELRGNIQERRDTRQEKREEIKSNVQDRRETRQGNRQERRSNR